MRPVRFSAILLAALLAASHVAAQEPQSAENTATLTVQSVVVEEGTKTARIPITIASEHPGQRINGLAMSVQAGTEFDPAPIVDHKSAFTESVWNAHPRVIELVQPFGPNAVQYIAITWQEPWDAIEAAGVVCIVTVDVSGLKSNAEYPVVADFQGRTSATVTADGLMFYPLRLTCVEGKIKVVPKRSNNLNQ
jgi:hypothetical protein